AALSGHGPVKYLVGDVDVASLAMHAIREVNFQTEPFCFTGDRRAVDLPRHLIDSRGAKILARISVLFHAPRNANIGIENMQMTWLVFVVARTGMVDVGKAIESEFTVSVKPFRGVQRALRGIDLLVVLVSL